MKSFPPIKVQYHMTNTHILSDYYYAIPHGPKYYVWFTYEKGDYVCLFLEVNNRKITNTRKEIVCFDEQLYGTILHGTMVSNKFFVTENIYYYKHDNISYKSNREKLDILLKVFRQIKQLSYNKGHKIICMPMLSDNYNDLIAKKIPYKVYGIGLLSIVGIPLLVFIVEQMKYNVAYVGRYSSPLAGCVPRNKHPTFWIIWIFVQFMSLLFILGFSVYLIIK